jgi:catechol-2,3-dioxygenase
MSETDVLAPARLAHVVLRTRNLAEVSNWWKTVLNARVAYENDFMCFLAYDDEHHRIAIVAPPKLKEDKPKFASGMDHVAFTYASLEDLIKTYERLRSLGIEPYWAVNHGPTLSMYYRDPDGNQAELQIDRFETLEEADAFFKSDTFAKNPIGITIDSAELAQRFRNGEPAESLTAYVQ